METNWGIIDIEFFFPCFHFENEDAELNDFVKEHRMSWMAWKVFTIFCYNLMTREKKTRKKSEKIKEKDNSEWIRIPCTFVDPESLIKKRYLRSTSGEKWAIFFSHSSVE